MSRVALETKRDHNLKDCDCGDTSCYICGGGLSYCMTCKGAEASLPYECPGRPMTVLEESGVSTGYHDFKDGKWVRSTKLNFGEHDASIWRSPARSNCDHARVALEQNKKVDDVREIAASLNLNAGSVRTYNDFIRNLLTFCRIADDRDFGSLLLDYTLKNYSFTYQINPEITIERFVISESGMFVMPISERRKHLARNYVC